jgi:acyl-CoA thioester hydrolase
MSPTITTVDLRVRYAETDQMGVVYHANYLIWCEIGRTDYIRAVGASYRDMEKHGLGLAVAEASLRYHAPARYDDLIRVATTLSEVRSRTMTFDYVVTNADSGVKLATARTVLIGLDRSGRTVSFPSDVRALLTAAAGR